MNQQIMISKESVQSLFIEMFFDDTLLSSGTAFVAEASSGPVLITNRHNVTGLNQDTGKPLAAHGGVPNKIRVWRNVAGRLGLWHPFFYRLLDDDGNHQWYEHPTFGAQADFVALPVDRPFAIEDHPYATSKSDRPLMLRPSEIVSVIGFPFGKTAGGYYGIWVSGFLASEPDVDYEDLPQILIDCRTRPGQSGSPVLAVRRGTVTYKDGGTDVGEDRTELIGIYSGRINKESDLGKVWKRQAIDELIKSLPDKTDL